MCRWRCALWSCYSLFVHSCRWSCFLVVSSRYLISPLLPKHLQFSRSLRYCGCLHFVAHRGRMLIVGSGVSGGSGVEMDKETALGVGQLQGQVRDGASAFGCSQSLTPSSARANLRHQKWPSYTPSPYQNTRSSSITDFLCATPPNTDLILLLDTAKEHTAPGRSRKPSHNAGWQDIV